MNRIIETCKSGSDHSFPDSAASKPPQNFLYQPPSLFSVDVTKTEIDFNNRNPKCASCCTFPLVACRNLYQFRSWKKNPKIKKKHFLQYCIC